MKRTMIDHIRVDQKQTFERLMIVPVVRVSVCTVVDIPDCAVSNITGLEYGLACCLGRLLAR
jgi:hypothetical protein